ncbi:hypothetical protein WALBB_460001 [Wolbachia pipientis wAlbB]|nr:hypothetical protein WALBB_460001 [Wolbachia pipientis wAlbB]
MRCSCIEKKLTRHILPTPYYNIKGIFDSKLVFDLCELNNKNSVESLLAKIICSAE